MIGLLVVVHPRALVVVFKNSLLLITDHSVGLPSESFAVASSHVMLKSFSTRVYLAGGVTSFMSLSVRACELICNRFTTLTSSLFVSFA